MISSGIRIGAWDFLKWKHAKPFHNENGEVIAAKLNVYAEEPDEYYPLLIRAHMRPLKNGWISVHPMVKG
jgi:hypothetical protein